jgi:peptidoglycan glycosyltransferase
MQASEINLLDFVSGGFLDAAVMVLRMGFLLTALAFVVLLFRRFRQHTLAGGPNRVLGIICMTALFAILIHQGIWQLAGFRNAEFVAFMNRYSPRVTASETSMQRGRIVDRNGVVLAETVRGDRRYPNGLSAAHVTGYVHTKYGKTGVERADDAHLRGATVATSAESLQRFARNLVNHRLITGYDTVLTIDARLQAEAYRLLGDNRGAIVGISPRDGAILVLVSTPSFNPESPEKAISNNDTSLFNRALLGLYPPGSSYKTMVAAVATEYGMGGVLDCPAEGIAAEPGVRPIRDHEYYAYARESKQWRGHGRIDIREGFARSSNVYFARLGLLLGANRMNEINHRFAFNQSLAIFTGSDGTIESEVSKIPVLASEDRKEIAQVAIGQGAAVVTPLHMAVATAAIANGGTLHYPFLNAANRNETSSVAISPKAAKHMAEYMARVVTSGTGSGARIHNLPVAGKTGTAQTPSGDDHGWFVAFGPVSSPELALAVVVENSGYGSKRAVPIARALFVAAEAMGLLRGEERSP